MSATAWRLTRPAMRLSPATPRRPISPARPTNNIGSLRATNSGYADVFVTAFNPDASAVLYSTLLGGEKNDYGYGIAVDPAGNAYVVGQTASTNFTTTPGAFQTFRNGTNDTFLAKILLQTQPALAITAPGGTNVTLTWPAFEPEFILESSTNLASTNWLAVPQLRCLTNGSTDRQHCRRPMTPVFPAAQILRLRASFELAAATNSAFLSP